MYIGAHSGGTTSRKILLKVSKNHPGNEANRMFVKNSRMSTTSEFQTLDLGDSNEINLLEVMMMALAILQVHKNVTYYEYISFFYDNFKQINRNFIRSKSCLSYMKLAGPSRVAVNNVRSQR